MTYTISVHLGPDEIHERMSVDAIAGLRAEHKSIPPVWFYDERGSQLFEEITRLPEYYPTRAERHLLQAHSLQIAELSKADTLVELVPVHATRPGCSSMGWSKRHLGPLHPFRRQRRVPPGGGLEPVGGVRLARGALGHRGFPPSSR